MSRITDRIHASRACCPASLPVPDGVRDGAARLAPVCKALGEATRLQIAGLLARAGDYLCACEIEAHFDLSQPTISHHLRVLRQAGLVQSERRGTWIYYRLDPAVIQAARSLAALVGDPSCCAEEDPKERES